MASLGVPGQEGRPAPPQDEITDFEDLQSCGMELEKLAGYCMDLRPTCSTPQ
jgi:hypothetical protein